MIATTNISKEEWLEKIENAKRLLYSYEKADRRYIVDEVFLNRLFEIATTAIPVEWILKWACEFCNPNSEGYKMAMELIHDWEKENGR